MRIESLLQAPEKISTKTPFLSEVVSWVQDTNRAVMQADQSLQSLSKGEGVSLHATMILLKEAQLSLQFLEEIRSKLLSAYQEVIREQL